MPARLSVSYTVQASESYCTKRILGDDIVLTVYVSYISAHLIALVICCKFLLHVENVLYKYYVKCNVSMDYTGFCCLLT